MNKLYTALTVLFGVMQIYVSAQQNANLQIRITRLERQPYGDCTACGDPDPTWKIQSTHNGTGALTYGPNCWHYGEMNFTLWDINDFNLMNVVNTNATTFTVGLNDAFEKSCSNDNCTYQSYNFFTCFPSVNGDSRRCQNLNLVTQNFRTFAPCQWHTFWSPWCGDFRFEYSFYWSFNYAPTISVQPVASTQACANDPVTLTVAAANDPNGWNMGQNFQWQTSSSTACPGTGWTNIASSNTASFTVPPTPGTRLYRALVTSNCTPTFATNVTVSNCASVTYNPIGSPGDLVPDIVSGICGSTVLPGSTHSLTIVTPPTPGAVIGATGYTWSATGGSPTSFNGPIFSWTAPVNPGTYNINLTYNDACPQPDAVSNACVVTVGSATCDFAYVATYGEDSVYSGGPDNPYKTLAYAISQLNGRKYIRMATGVYNETDVLQLENNLVIEGGYRVNGNIWSKSNIDSTVIIASGAQLINNNIGHRVGFLADNDDNWVLQDLVIRTTNTTAVTPGNRGYSNYAVLAINGSSGFEIVRCKIYAGNAAKGTNGTTPAGAGGAGGGGNGGNGGNGNGPSCGGCGQNGQAGSAGNGGASAGNGGGNCCGSGCNIFGCNAQSCTAGNGQPGSVGAVGAGFAAGNKPPTPPAVSPYYTPAGQSATGSNGFGGGGGGGGGGGDMGTDCTCSQNGNANGGAGGVGGGGGLPGTGGFGGGGAFGVYVSGAGSSGNLITTFVQAGTAGPGGDGAVGQNGGAGANGVPGNVTGGSCSPSGRGGAGGRGGDGGQGGRGQDGADGLAQNILTVGGATISGTSLNVPNTATVSINYQNTKACINSEIELTKNTGVWSFPTGIALINDLRDQPAGFPVTSYNNSSSPVLVSAVTANTAYDLTINGVTYNKFLRVAADNRQLPVIQTTGSVICINGVTTFSASSWGTEVEYDWRIYQGTNVNSPLFQSTLPSPTVNFFGFQPGLYVVRYRVREACCGWSKPVFDTLRIAPEPFSYNVAGGGNYCPGANGAVVTLSGSEPGVQYILLYDGVPVDSLIGTGGPLAFAPQTGIGNYTVNAIRFGGCEQLMFGTATIGQFPVPQQFTVSGSDTICLAGQNLSATVQLNGSELGVNYQLLRSGTIPVGPAVPGTGGSMQFGGITQPGTYFIEAISTVTGCRIMMEDSAVIEAAPLPQFFTLTGGGSYCASGTGVVVGLSGSEAGTSYQLFYQGVLPVNTVQTGTGNAISFGNVTQAGFYKVKATSDIGCEVMMLDSVVVSITANPDITGVAKTDVSCNGASDGTITIQASSATAPYSYSIDSAANFVATNAFTGLGAGSYHVFVQDANGCTTRYVVNPVVIAQPQAIVVSLESVDSIYCNGTSNGAVRISVYGGSVPYTFSWSNGSTLEDISQIAAGTYTVTVTDQKLCTATLTTEVPQPLQPLTITTIPVNVKCFSGNDGTVTIEPIGGTAPYEFYLNGVYQSSSQFTGLVAGIYTAQVKDANGCTAASLFTITQPQAFSVNAGPDKVSVKGQPVELSGTATSANGIIGYWWTPDYNLSCSACQSTTARPDSSFTYVLIAMDGDSCVGFDSVLVVVKGAPQVFIPTAFTPNGDGLNDLFEFDILGASTIETQVFNRWGERVYFNANQPNGNSNGNAWNGTKEGKRLPHDTYVYQLKVVFFDNSEDIISGTVVLMR